MIKATIIDKKIKQNEYKILAIYVGDSLTITKKSTEPENDSRIRESAILPI